MCHDVEVLFQAEEVFEGEGGSAWPFLGAQSSCSTTCGLSYQLLLGPELVLCGRVPAVSRAAGGCAVCMSPLTPASLPRWTSPAWAYPHGTIT